MFKKMIWFTLPTLLVILFGTTIAKAATVIAKAAPVALARSVNDAGWTLNGLNIYKTDVNGNVGIGTTAPAQKLDLVGNINISAGSAYLYNGANAVIASTTRNNYFFGGAGNLTMTGNNNTATGYQATLNNGSGYGNTATGYQAMRYNSNGFENTAVGYQALYAGNDGAQNTALGSNSLFNSTSGAIQNVAAGYKSMQSNQAGSYNSAFGSWAMQGNRYGNNNVAIGKEALFSIVESDFNTAVGSRALYDLIISNDSGNNTALGFSTGRGITTGINNTILGANVSGLPSSLSNNIIIADGSGNQRIRVDSSGNVGIGTTNPTVKLEVNGDIKVTGRLTVDGYNSSDGTPGITQDFVFINNKDQTCTLAFKGGLLTSSVCK